jgi:hypothetical protein
MLILSPTVEHPIGDIFDALRIKPPFGAIAEDNDVKA